MIIPWQMFLDVAMCSRFQIFTCTPHLLHTCFAKNMHKLYNVENL